MKKWFAYSAIFFSVYLVFLITSIPLNVVLGFVSLPKNINLQGVTGTVWQAEINQASYDDVVVNKVIVNTGFWSLLTLDPTFKLKFGGSLVDGPEGKLKFSGLLSTLTVEQLEVNVSANDIAQKLPLPIPLSAKGYVDLSMQKLVLAEPAGKAFCQQADGDITWPKATISALGETVELGKISAKLSCEQGALAVKVTDKNDLGLSFTAFVNKGGRFSGNGYLQPGQNFPAQLREVLPFIGNADNKGRYRLRF
ncbi:MAG: type II secretion system protein N [Alteromonadaceae bacterium]|nr:type II secretion system protein N [Alteromonadaceae bacterium]